MNEARTEISKKFHLDKTEPEVKLFQENPLINCFLKD